MTMLVRMPSPMDKAATANFANVMRSLESIACISKPSAWSPRVAAGTTLRWIASSPKAETVAQRQPQGAEQLITATAGSCVLD
jgi:hypothetical protein